MGLSGRRLTVALTGVLIAVLAVGAGAAFAVGRAQRLAGAASTGHGSSSAGHAPSATGRSATPVGGSSTPAPSGNSAGAGQPTPPSAIGSRSSDSTSSSDGTVEVTLSPAAEASPQGQAVAGLLKRYFSAINQHDYDAWLATVSTAQAKRDPDDWAVNYSTTHDSDVYVSDIVPGDPLLVRLQFVSHQSVKYAPTNLPLPCVRWDVTYQILDEGTGLRVGTSAKPSTMAPCT